jgi:hypothetical protein
MKYQEALDRIKSERLWDEGLGDYYNVFDRDNKDLKLIQELVDKETELQSRKDKLVVGSEWECVVKCHGVYADFSIGEIVIFYQSVRAGI